MTDVRWERIPLLWSTVRETALPNDFCSYMADSKHPCVRRGPKLPGKGVHSKIREICI